MACQWQFIGWKSMFKKDWEELIQTLCYLKICSVLLQKILRSKVLKDFSNLMLHKIQITACNASRLTVGLWSDRYFFQLLWMWLLLFIFFSFLRICYGPSDHKGGKQGQPGLFDWDDKMCNEARRGISKMNESAQVQCLVILLGNNE